MKAFTVYEVATGRIVRRGTCQPEFFDQQSGSAAEAVLSGNWDDADYMVVTGAPSPRPQIVIQHVNGRAIELDSAVPAGAQLRISGQFVSDLPLAISGSAFYLETPEPVELSFELPWPWTNFSVPLVGIDDPIPAGAQVIPTELPRMRSYYKARIAEVGSALLRQILKPRTDVEQLAWIVQRDMLHRHQMGTLNAVETANIAEALRHTTGRTVQDVLSDIAALAEYQDFVAFRHLGLHEEAYRRIDSATSAAEIIAAKNWVEAEALVAVQEAQARMPT